MPSYLIHTVICDVGTAPIPALQMKKLRLRLNNLSKLTQIVLKATVLTQASLTPEPSLLATAA